MKKRVSAFLMAFVMMFAILPIQSTTIEATEVGSESSEAESESSESSESTEAKSEEISFTLTDSQGTALSDTQIVCTVKLESGKTNAQQKEEVITTDSDGKGVIPVTDATIEKAIRDGKKVKIDYVVTANGYSGENFSAEYEKAQTDFKLVALKLYTVTVVSAYSDSFGNVEINGEKKYAGEPVYVTEDTEATVKITPNKGYMISELMVNDEAQKIDDPTEVNEFTLSNIKSYQNIYVSFVKYYTVKLTGTGNGNLSVNEDTDSTGGEVNSYIAENGNAVVKATPKEHYNIISVRVDGRGFQRSCYRHRD